jgi:hypothetical protein
MRYADAFGSTPRGSSGFKLTFGEDNEQSRTRMRELILYIAEQCKDDSRFGATKLNKVLYYSDFVAFKRYGKPITGAQYMRLNHGPAPTHLVPVREDMVAKNEIEVAKRDYWTWTQTVIKPLRTANLDLFSPREISLVDRVIKELWNSDAHEVSERSHNRGWKAAQERDGIPYEAIFLSDEPLNEDDIDFAYNAAFKAGWIDAPF